MLSVRLLVNSKLLVGKFSGSQKSYTDFLLHGHQRPSPARYSRVNCLGNLREFWSPCLVILYILIYPEPVAFRNGVGFNEQILSCSLGLIISGFILSYKGIPDVYRLELIWWFQKASRDPGCLLFLCHRP